MYQAIMKKTETKSASANEFADFIKYLTAAGGISGGILLMLTGLILWGVSGYQNKSHDPWELILFVSAFVFLGVGAHGLDLLHSAKREATKRRLNL